MADWPIQYWKDWKVRVNATAKRNILFAVAHTPTQQNCRAICQTAVTPDFSLDELICFLSLSSIYPSICRFSCLKIINYHISICLWTVSSAGVLISERTATDALDLKLITNWMSCVNYNGSAVLHRNYLIRFNHYIKAYREEKSPLYWWKYVN